MQGESRMGVSVCKGKWSDPWAIEEGTARVTERGKLLEALAAIAFSDIRDYFELKSGSMKLKKLGEIDPVKLHALKTYRTDKTGRLLSIRLHDKGWALAMLLKLTGGHAQRIVLTDAS
jgi:hypothetical protein